MAVCLWVVILATGCGGGAANSDRAGAGPRSPSALSGLVGATAPAVAARAAAATAAANSSINGCSTIRPFYWEIGDRNGALVWGSVDAEGVATTYTGGTVIPVASASKWLYSAYFIQRTAGALSSEDIKFLTLRSGYTRFLMCPQSVTVMRCLDIDFNAKFIPENEGLFFYGGGHMQEHAAINGLGSLGAAELAGEMRSQLGNDVFLSFSSPQPAGGAIMSPAEYAKVLRKMINGQLLIGGMLGASAVCADPVACPDEAVTTAAPEGETWHYSLGHWVEDDPRVGDGAFSSPGLLGFYPWIDNTRSWYGIVARVENDGDGSVYCGRAIRRAWLNASPMRLLAGS